jgi:hypothetical protein
MTNMAINDIVLNSPGGTFSKFALDFDGSNDLLTSNAAPIANLMRNIGGATVFSVCQVPADGTQSIVSFNTAAASLARFLQRRENANGWSHFGRRLDADSGANVSGGTHVVDPIIFRNFADFQNATVRVAVNGIQVASSTSFQTAGNTSDTSSSWVSFGGSTSVGTAGTALLNGAISEVLIYRRALTATEIARIERALSSKWGITL